jgi:hypothetical protein
MGCLSWKIAKKMDDKIWMIWEYHPFYEGFPYGTNDDKAQDTALAVFSQTWTNLDHDWSSAETELHLHPNLFGAQIISNLRCFSRSLLRHGELADSCRP